MMDNYNKKVYMKAYQQEHRKEINENSLRWYHRNKDDPCLKEKRKEYSKKYYETHKNDPEYKERMVANAKRWRANHPEKRREYYLKKVSADYVYSRASK